MTMAMRKILWWILGATIMILTLRGAMAANLNFTRAGLGGGTFDEFSLAALNTNEYVVAYEAGADLNFTVSYTNGTVISNGRITSIFTDTNANSVKVLVFNTTHWGVMYYNSTTNIAFSVVRRDGTRLANVSSKMAYNAANRGAATLLNSTHFIMAYSDISGAVAYAGKYDVEGNTIISPTIVYNSGGALLMHALNVEGLNSTHFVLSASGIFTDDDSTRIIIVNTTNGGISSSALKNINKGGSDDAVALLRDNLGGFIIHYSNGTASDTNATYTKIAHYDGNVIQIGSNITTDTKGSRPKISAFNSTDFVTTYLAYANPNYAVTTTYSHSATTLTSVAQVVNLTHTGVNIDVASNNTATGIGFCDNNLIVGAKNAAYELTLLDKAGAAWDGNCNRPPVILSQNSFINWTAYHSFNVSAGVTEVDGYSDLVSTNITTSSGSCAQLKNWSSGYTFNVTYNCTGTALTATTVTIGFQDAASNYVSTTPSQNTYPNQLPTITNANVTLNNTAPADDDDIKCVNDSISDADGDAIQSLIYDWQKNDVWQGINSVNLSAAHTAVGERWGCLIRVNDSYQLSVNYTSGIVSIGTSYRFPVIGWVNATTIGTGLPSNANTPSNNNTNINLSVNYTDDNAGERYTVYWCKSPGITLAGCSGDTWCKSANNDTGSPLNCTISASGLTSSSYDYYTYIVDNSSLISTVTTGAFHINHPPSATLSYPSNNTWYNSNWTWINLSYADSDSDAVNYSIWCNNSLGDLLYVSDLNTTYYNYSGLNESVYDCVVQPEDQHAYSGLNSSTYIFKIDYTAPIINSTYTDKAAYSTSEQAIIYLNCTDSFSGIKTSYSPTVFLNLSDGTEDSTTLTYSSGDLYLKSSYSLLGIAGTYSILWSTCQDDAGNLVNTTSTYTFTASTPVVELGGGGGGGGVVKPPQEMAQQPKLETIASKCGDGICDKGEEPLSDNYCQSDCGKVFDLEAMFCWPIPECGNWKHAWFTNLIIIIVVAGLIVLQWRKGKS